MNDAGNVIDRIATRARAVRVFRAGLFPVFILLLYSVWYHYVAGFLDDLYAPYWKEALTMVLGSFVAGSTPLGGGAVSFPIFSQLLGVSIQETRQFGVMIQSIGMSCASLYFISSHKKIYFKEIAYWIIPSSMMILVLSPFTEALDGISKITFTFFELMVLFILNKKALASTRRTYSAHVLKSGSIILALLGGFLTATLGSGSDIAFFVYLTYFRNIPPKLAIPSTVLFMALNAIISSTLGLYSHGVGDYVYYTWLACVPIVAVGAPLGGFVLSQTPKRYIVAFINALIALEILSTLFIINISTQYKAIHFVLLLIFLLILFLTRDNNKVSAPVD